MNNCGLNRIYITELIKRINKKDYRSGIKWCKKNDVPIYKDSTGTFIIEGEFNYAYNLPVIKEYQSKYGSNWEEVYELCLENKLHLYEGNYAIKSNNYRYKSKSNINQSFIDQFK